MSVPVGSEVCASGGAVTCSADLFSGGYTTQLVITEYITCNASVGISNVFVQTLEIVCQQRFRRQTKHLLSLESQPDGVGNCGNFATNCLTQTRTARNNRFADRICQKSYAYVMRKTRNVAVS